LIAVGEERVRVERPQPRSGEDERPGRVMNRRQDGWPAEGTCGGRRWCRVWRRRRSLGR
jgi:hypothetical protein